ncbi:MAG: flagellar hook-basal body complex protein [Oscillibacter sp.]|nr:flagellar hook-basal body complex protein [Oscillibacter sp.]
MQKLSVIGNNVANVNTQGYKTQRTVFRDSVYSMYRSGSDGTQVVGGKNPSQLGYGSMVASIDLDMTSATYNPGNSTDCAIVGDGFFLVGDKDVANIIDPTNPTSFKSLNLSRVGDFHQDANGYFVDGTGQCVYGFLCVGVSASGEPIISDQLVPLRVPRMEKVPVNIKTGEEVAVDATTGKPDATAGVEGTDWEYRNVIRWPQYKNENAGGTGGGTTNTTTNIKLQDAVKKVGTGDTATTEPLPPATIDGISIDEKTGCISGTTKDTKEEIVLGYIAIGSVTNPNGVSHIGSSYYTAGAGAGDLNVTMLGGVAKEITTIDAQGKEVVGMHYVNGSIQSLYRTENQGNANDPVSENDLPEESQLNSAGSTTLMTGFLEAPNVDLATEISELITTQRGYQANTRIITVTDSMLEELVNMKR